MLVDGLIGAVCALPGGPGASKGNSKSAISLGKQLTKRIANTGEWKKAFAYYGKNMMNGAGKSIYKSLGQSLSYSALVGGVINISRSLIGCYL